MENSKYQRIARIIAFIDEIWSLIDFLFIFINFFGGEIGNGLFYQVEYHAENGLPPDQVTGKKALTGLLFFITLVYNLIWVFAGYMLFKGTETTSPCPVLYRKKLQYCRIWFSASFLLLLVPGINMFIYMTGSLYEIFLAMSAFLTRGVFMYLVLKYMILLQKGPSHLPQIQTVLYSPSHNPHQIQRQNSTASSNENTPFKPNANQGGGQGQGQGHPRPQPGGPRSKNQSPRESPKHNHNSPRRSRITPDSNNKNSNKNSNSNGSSNGLSSSNVHLNSSGSNISNSNSKGNAQGQGKGNAQQQQQPVKIQIDIENECNKTKTRAGQSTSQGVETENCGRFNSISNADYSKSKSNLRENPMFT